MNPCTKRTLNDADRQLIKTLKKRYLPSASPSETKCDDSHALQLLKQAITVATSEAAACERKWLLAADDGFEQQQPLYKDFKNAQGRRDSLIAQLEALETSAANPPDDSPRTFHTLTDSHIFFLVNELVTTTSDFAVSERAAEILDAVLSGRLKDRKSNGKDLTACLKVGIASVRNGTWKTYS